MTFLTSTPLLDIERSVQKLAQEAEVDISMPGNRDRLITMIHSEMDRWQESNRSRFLSEENRQVISSRIEANIAGYGPLQTLLDDDSVWEVMINAHDSIFVRRHGKPTTFYNGSFHDPDHLRRTIAHILADSGMGQRTLEPADGLQDSQLRGGSRLHVVHSDLTREGSLVVNIRKFTGLPNRSLSELVTLKMLTSASAAFLEAAQRAKASILFAGPPGSGKTTLLSTLATELEGDTRVVIAEEVLETHIPLPNVAHLQTRPTRPDRPGIDLRQLVAGFLRMAPDVAIVGEVRDREALPLILTLSSGVPGYTTIHATSARAALARLRLLIEIAGHQIPFGAVTHMVSEAIDVVVFCTRLNGTPRVTEIITVEEQNGGADAMAFTATPIFQYDPKRSILFATGQAPTRLALRSRVRGEEVAFDLQADDDDF